jgi:hypothetical protein
MQSRHMNFFSASPRPKQMSAHPTMHLAWAEGQKKQECNVTIWHLRVLRSRIFGGHLHVLEPVVTFVFVLKFLIGLFMERHLHSIHPGYNNEKVNHKVGLLIVVYTGHEISMVHYGLTWGVTHGGLRGKWIMGPWSPVVRCIDISVLLLAKTHGLVCVKRNWTCPWM